MATIIFSMWVNAWPVRHGHIFSLWLGGSCVWPASRQGHRQEETGRQRYTLGKVQRLSCFDAKIPNKKFLVAKPLYLEGHFWLSICCHLSPCCPHSCVARREDATLWSETSLETVWCRASSNCSLHGFGARPVCQVIVAFDMRLSYVQAVESWRSIFEDLDLEDFMAFKS